jgi:CRISPR/Cas system-associated exonuclease Cas4 (RecB family)
MKPSDLLNQTPQKILTSTRPLTDQLPENTSFSQSYTYSICPRKYFLAYVVGLKEGPRANMQHGIGLHDALAHLNKKFRDQGRVGVEEGNEAVGIYEESGGLLVAQRLKEADKVLRLYCKEELHRREPEHVESHVSVVLKPSDTRLRGYIDLIGKVDGAKKMITDFKCTAKAPDKNVAKNSLQLAIYGAAAGTSRAELMHLWTTRAGPQLRRTATIIDQRRIDNAASYLDGLEASIKLSYKTRHWPKRAPDNTCSYCYLKQVCWADEVPARLKEWEETHGRVMPVRT